MTQEELNEYIDYPVPDEHIKELNELIIKHNWEPTKSLWMGNQPADFYKGLYAMIRVVRSFDIDATLALYLDNISIDCMYFINKQSENKSKS